MKQSMISWLSVTDGQLLRDVIPVAQVLGDDDIRYLDALKSSMKDPTVLANLLAAHVGHEIAVVATTRALHTYIHSTHFKAPAPVAAAAAAAAAAVKYTPSKARVPPLPPKIPEF